MTVDAYFGSDGSTSWLCVFVNNTVWHWILEFARCMLRVGWSEEAISASINVDGCGGGS